MNQNRVVCHITAAVCLAASVGLASTTPSPGVRESDSHFKALTNATVVVSPGQRIENATLVIRDGRVKAVGAGLPVPAGATEVDLTGMTVYPGFVDPVTEYGLAHVGDLNDDPAGDDPIYEADRTGAAAWNSAVHAARNWVDEFSPDSDAAESLLARGVTTVQSSKLDGIFRGRGFAASLGEGLANDLVLVPHTLHFGSFDPGSSPQEYPTSLMGSIFLLRQNLMDAAWYERAHAAFERNPNQDRPELNRDLAALSSNDSPILFETDGYQSLLRAARISREMGVPMIHVGSNSEYQRLDEIAALDATLILPASFPETPSVATLEDALDVELADLRHWETAPSNPAMLAERGVRFAWTGNGMRDDEDFFTNVRKAVERGLDPATALAALTTVPAEIAGVTATAGTLDSGKRADLVIADGDLLEDGTEIVGTWVAGVAVHEAREIGRPDLRGTYSMATDSGVFELEISGDLDDPEGSLDRDGEEVPTHDFEAGRTHLSFAASLSDSGVTRVSLTKVGDALHGNAALPDGSLYPVAMTPVTPEQTAVDEEDGGEEGKLEDMADEEAEVLHARQTLPNVAFGYAELPQPENVVVRNATIWTNEVDGILEGADLYVANGRVTAVGTDLSVPAGTREIDGSGKHVTPGIIDEHAHIAISQGVNEASHAVTAEVRIGDVVNPDHIGIYRALAGGTTAAQLLHGSANPIGGQAQVIKLRWGKGSEELKFHTAPPSIKFALGENVKQSNWGDEYVTRYPQTRMGVETTMRDAFLAAQRYEAEHAAYQGLSSAAKARTAPPRRDLQLEALVEILNSERFVHCHSYVQSEILMLMRLAEELGFTVQTFTHILEGYKVAPEMAAHGAGGSTFSDWWAYKFEVYDAIPQGACLMHQAGVVTSINSDSSDLIRRLNTEASKSVLHCDMNEEDALKLATLNPAIQLKIDDRVGSLAVGKDGDFVIWNGHPLSMFTRAEQTWVDGTRYYSLEKDAEVRAAAATERQALVQKIIEKKEEPEPDEPDDGAGEEAPDNPTRSMIWSCDETHNVWRANHGS